jgi:hypothetical protein
MFHNISYANSWVPLPRDGPAQGRMLNYVVLAVS